MAFGKIILLLGQLSLCHLSICNYDTSLVWEILYLLQLNCIKWCAYHIIHVYNCTHFYCVLVFLYTVYYYSPLV